MSDAEQREEAVFEAALQLAVDQRAAYLDSACAGDADLRSRVQVLLGSFERAGGFMIQPAAPEMIVPFRAVPTEKPGDNIGRYKLLEQIGEGGCGVVYVAEQEQPVRRRVALKVIKLGMDTKQVIARFDAERQALAMMDHPNIAKIHDAGVTETGRPYFVMELVRGIKITDYCDQNHLPPRERLDLFIQVCRAIQHAHQKGVIHRDIKPSNILVETHDPDRIGMPKVIDFGIAKATQGRLTDQTVFTAFEQFIGTPAYMSPEQARMSPASSGDIDTRSDIYSLGVLLYELLTGKTPFDAKELLAAGLDEMRRTIREVEPVKPSTRLTQELGKVGKWECEKVGEDARPESESHSPTFPPAHFQHRLLHDPRELQRLISTVRGDLDWIVMKCLEKDRTRRYETANGLATDIGRHLNNEPVIARPPSRLYRFKKSVQRNKLAFGAGAGVATALVLGVIGTTVGFVRSERQRRIAEDARRLAQEDFDLARAGVADLLAVTDEDLYDQPGMQPLRAKLMRAAIDRYKSFLDRPSADPAPRAELARLYVKFGFFNFVNGEDYKRVAVPTLESGLAIQRQLLGENPENRALRSDLGWTCIFYAWGGDFNDAKNREIRAEAVALFEALVREAPKDPLARADLAWALWQSTWHSKGPQQYSFSERALAIREQLVLEFPHSAEFRRDLANSLQSHADFVARGDPAAALAMLSRAIELRAALIPDLERRQPEIFLPLRTLNSEARILRTALHWTKRDLALGAVLAARLRIRLGEWSEAMPLTDRAAAIYRPLADENPSIVRFLGEWGAALLYGAQAAEEARDTDNARSRRLQALDFLHAQFPMDDSARLAARLPGDDTDLLSDALSDLTETLLHARKFGDAEPFAREYFAIAEVKFPDDWRAFNARCLLGRVLLEEKNYADAQPLLLAGYEGLSLRADEIPAPEKNTLKEALQSLVQLDDALARPDEKAKWMQKLAEFDSSAK